MNKYHHSKKRGCVIVPKLFPTTRKDYFGNISGSFCTTHNADLCRCGFEWGAHYKMEEETKETVETEEVEETEEVA